MALTVATFVTYTVDFPFEMQVHIPSPPNTFSPFGAAVFMAQVSK
jgi:hypothetical protein